ncbi:hypothetical protein [Reyranella soli]|nr:hypothetical protein [Reyranella soli]
MHPKLTCCVASATIHAMHALQFVQEFATFTGQDYASLRVIDRALAERGLRAKAKGKRLPDVTLGEGVMFLLAVLANTQPTRAAEAALELAQSYCFSAPRHRNRKSLAMLTRMTGLPVTEWSGPKMRPPPRISASLINVVATLCRPRPGGRWAELSVQRDGPAFLAFGQADSDNHGELRFDNPNKVREPKSLIETRTAMPDLLRWIGENTVDEAPDWPSKRRD